MEKLVAQIYDGETVMSSELNGMQNKRKGVRKLCLCIVMRTNDSVLRVALNLEVSGKRKRGRLKKTWKKRKRRLV